MKKPPLESTSFLLMHPELDDAASLLQYHGEGSYDLRARHRGGAHELLFAGSESRRRRLRARRRAYHDESHDGRTEHRRGVDDGWTTDWAWLWLGGSGSVESLVTTKLEATTSASCSHERSELEHSDVMNSLGKSIIKDQASQRLATARCKGRSQKTKTRSQKWLTGLFRFDPV